MLLDDMLAALSEACGLRSAETRFVSAPQDQPFVIWDCSCETSGGDDAPAKRTYAAALTLVEHPGDVGCGAREALEAALDAAHLGWTRQMREWAEGERVYMTEYDFSWAEKA